MDSTIIVALVTGGLSLIGTLAGSYFSQKKSTALISYRLEALEKKVDKHNRVIDRTYKLEERVALTEKDIRVANHRIEDLEREKLVNGLIMEEIHIISKCLSIIRILRNWM